MPLDSCHLRLRLSPEIENTVRSPSWQSNRDGDSAEWYYHPGPQGSYRDTRAGLVELYCTNREWSQGNPYCWTSLSNHRTHKDYLDRAKQVIPAVSERDTPANQYLLRIRLNCCSIFDVTTFDSPSANLHYQVRRLHSRRHVHI